MEVDQDGSGELEMNEFLEWVLLNFQDLSDEAFEAFQYKCVSQHLFAGLAATPSKAPSTSTDSDSD